MADRKLILDLDTGIDDALAIAYALGSAAAPNDADSMSDDSGSAAAPSDAADLIAITGTFGNVAVPLGVRNSLAVLHAFGRDDVPVYPGVDHPWAYDAAKFGPWTPSAGSVAVHGENGLGGAELPDSPRAAEPAGSAVDFLIDAMRSYGDRLTIVPTGSLTTIATVLRKAPDVIDSGAHITLMGGALTVPGNVSPGAEANISQDPEAADYVFRCGARTTMIGLDVTHRTALTRSGTAQWRALHTAAGDFLADMTDYYIDYYLAHQPEVKGCGLHDPLAVAAALDPTLVTTLGVNLKVDLDGAFRGRTIGDRARLTDPVTTTRVAVRVNVERFLDRFMTRITALAAKH
ncbi:nucleoside hydrolase [Bifidobacterium jacchi]|uniref:Nucleoside hydrolase n=1 Tax=Bifidobacterium jacchi TaxID=2490545 RepID=A0A5N5RNN6_9BIFI|nr:nucleoside hydrolase [Bifidobacterium jacchi]KAB5608569.1 nucleoside hydrolase [Bifidobacterium jacchi]